MRKVRNVCKIIILAAVTALVLGGLSRVVEKKDSRFNKQPLYEMGAQPDVIFVGASRMHNAIYPVVLWEEHGIAAYNCASPGEQTGTTYYVLRQLLNDFSPKLVVFDLGLVSDTDEVSWSHEIGYIHESMDFMPLGKNKIELAKNVAEYNEMSPLAFLSNLYFYHDRWKELSGDDFDEKYSRELGAEILTRIVEKDAPEVFEPKENPEALKGAGFAYLEKMMELCREKGADFMFVNLPYASDDKKSQEFEYTYMQEAVRRGGYCLDLLRSMDEMGLSFAEDYADSGHVNLMGGVKLSSYLGDYLANEVGLSDRRSEDAYKSWADSAADHRYFKLESAQAAENAASAAMYAYAEPDWQLKIYEGAQGNLSRDPRCAMTAERCGGEILPESSMTDEEKKLMSDKYDGAKRINKDRIALYIEDRDTGNIRVMTLFTFKNGYEPDK